MNLSNGELEWAYIDSQLLIDTSSFQGTDNSRCDFISSPFRYRESKNGFLHACKKRQLYVSLIASRCALAHPFSAFMLYLIIVRNYARGRCKLSPTGCDLNWDFMTLKAE